MKIKVDQPKNKKKKKNHKQVFKDEHFNIVKEAKRENVSFNNIHASSLGPGPFKLEVEMVQS